MDATGVMMEGHSVVQDVGSVLLWTTKLDADGFSDVIDSLGTGLASTVNCGSNGFCGVMAAMVTQ